MRGCLVLASVVFGSWALLLGQETTTETPAEDSAKSENEKQPSKEKKPPKDQLTMTVITKTGSVAKWAKADKLQVFVTINNDEKHKIRIDNRIKGGFELGATDTFKGIPVKLPLDEIKTLRLSVEGKDMWKCETISFQFFQKGLQSHKYKFTPARYLSGEKERKGFTATTHVDFKLPSEPKLAPPEKDDDSEKEDQPAKSKEKKEEPKGKK